MEDRLTRARASRCAEPVASGNLSETVDDGLIHTVKNAENDVVETEADIRSALETTPTIFRRKAVAGSLIGADVEVIRIQDIGAAFERLERADVKSRFVVDMASLKA